MRVQYTEYGYCKVGFAMLGPWHSQSEVGRTQRSTSMAIEISGQRMSRQEAGLL